MSIIVGIDEAGRGCWAGPLVAAAVMLRRPVAGLTDSKQLSRARRAELDGLIRVSAEVGVGVVSAKQVDQLGLTRATALAMSQAVSQLTGYDEVIIDGNYNYLPDHPNVTVLPKADSLVPAVSAASIVAKVARDNYMLALSQKHPEYQFDSHVGYGTALHRRLIIEHGVCDEHRLTYKPIKAILELSNV